MSFRYIKLSRNDKYLLRFKVKGVPERYGSPSGEVDIFIKIPRSLSFRHVCLQTADGKKQYPSAINKISWHGFYAEIGEDVKMPVINFKSDSTKIAEVRHNGTVNQSDIFLFPICSVYVPRDIDWDMLPDIDSNEPVRKVQIQRAKDCRVDFFVLPKEIPIERFMGEASLSIFYFVSDITVFNKAVNGELKPLPVENRDEDLVFWGFRLGGWDVLVRLVYSTDTGSSMDGTFSILFHDPNDAIDMLLNRLWAYPEPDDESKVEFEDLRKRHSKEMRTILDE